MQQPQSPTAAPQSRHPWSSGPSAPSTCPRTSQLPMFRSTSRGTTQGNPWAQGHVQWPPPSLATLAEIGLRWGTSRTSAPASQEAPPPSNGHLPGKDASCGSPEALAGHWQEPHSSTKTPIQSCSPPFPGPWTPMVGGVSSLTAEPSWLSSHPAAFTLPEKTSRAVPGPSSPRPLSQLPAHHREILSWSQVSVLLWLSPLLSQQA